MNFHNELQFDLSINRKMFDITDIFDQMEITHDELHLDNYFANESFPNRRKTIENQPMGN